MSNILCLATDNGIVIAERTDDWHIVRRGLNEQQVTSVLAREGVILAGTLDGIYRSDDEGRTWREASVGLSQRHIRWLAYHPDISDAEFAGTEPASIFLSKDGGGYWQECIEVAKLRDQHHWFLPYSPEAGCVRGFAFHGSRAYAAVEVGGVLRSDDTGASWHLAEGSDGNPDLSGPPEPFIYPDLHSIHIYPSSPDLVLAPTGGGFYRSADGGQTWHCLYDCYCRAAWIDPLDAQHIILGPADNVDARGRIEQTRDGGKTWQAASHGLAVPWSNHMVERFTPLGADELCAVLSNGQVLCAALATLQWRPVLPELTNVNAVAEMKL